MTDLASGQLPLKGKVLCCTSVTQDVRNKVAEVAASMGAAHSLDLTANVTHLIVGSVTTPKYQYVARERPDIAVLHPDWIEALRNSWMEGGDVDVSQLEKDFKLPTFHGLKMSVTGFDDMDQRNFISTTIEQEGAEYHGDLTKQVTHLVVAAPSGAKYVAARQWGTTVVSYKWFEDSLKRGMSLDENLYDPLLPAHEQGQNAFKEEVKARINLGKRTRDGDVPAVSVDDVGKRKLRRTASSRLHNHSQDLWQDISAREGAVEQTKTDQWEDEGGQQVEATIQRATTPQVMVKPPGNNQQPDSLLTGRHVLIYGFDEEKVNRLRRFLEPNGAVIATSAADLERAAQDPTLRASYLLVPHAIKETSMKLPEVPTSTFLVTEWWLERCVQSKAVMDPNKDILSCPLWDFDTTAFQALIVATTGFSSLDLRQLAQAVKITGATYSEKLTPSASVLVSGTEAIKKEKAYYATKHSIPVVSSSWLWDCLRMKHKAPFDKYRLTLPAFDPKDIMSECSASNPAATLTCEPSGISNSERKDRAQQNQQSDSMKQRHSTSLPIQAAKVARKSRGPFFHEDEDSDTQSPTTPVPKDTSVSLKQVQPLRDITPNVSPRKNKSTSNDNDDDHSSHVNERKQTPALDRNNNIPMPSPPTSNPSQNQAQPEIKPDGSPERRAEELNATMTSLLNRAVASNNIPELSSTTKRKNRPLGRNLSGNAASHRSASPSVSREISSAADGFAAQPFGEPQLPSTQLGYETLAQEQHRLAVEKKMNIKLSDEHGHGRVPKIGTVQDSTSRRAENASGNRSRGRNRAT
ncbi:Hypothetical protein R9X50_00501000 [Acrodontium crateriforme]|uniref:BRCT domain-containing protein n=1 Tax=Acrodontium crateriforme TaxID=150365 RepID=A0AAQ3M6C9_9PEZI|nr:Hypothetical protein R9X50_00501000 [Acrodontium crateriforme]